MMSPKFALAILISLLLISPAFTSAIKPPLRKSGSVFGSATNKYSGNNIVKAVANFAKKVGLKDWAKKKTDEIFNGQPSKNSSTVSQPTGVYEIYFGIGTLAQNVSGVMDTSSGLIWTQCKTCSPCFTQSKPLYDPKQSTTYSNFSSLRCNSTSFIGSSVCEVIQPDLCPNGCDYSISYSDDQNSTGYVGMDTFTLGTSSVPDILFGCGTQNYGDFDNTSGVLALGKGPLSFVSQLEYMRFSYCLSSDPTKESPINFGSYAQIKKSGQTTPLVSNDNYTDLYYIGLVDFTIGPTRVNIPSTTFAIKANGSGGVVLSTSFPVTYLEQAGYDLVRKAFVSQINLKPVNGSYLGLDLCYQSLNNWPTLTLNFAGGASLTVNSVNYVLNDTSNGIACLTILPSEGISILGSFIQMDTNFVYDIENSTISFERTECTASSVMSMPNIVTIIVLFLVGMVTFV